MKSERAQIYMSHCIFVCLRARSVAKWFSHLLSLIKLVHPAIAGDILRAAGRIFLLYVDNSFVEEMLMKFKPYSITLPFSFLHFIHILYFLLFFWFASKCVRFICLCHYFRHTVLDRHIHTFTQLNVYQSIQSNEQQHIRVRKLIN